MLKTTQDQPTESYGTVRGRVETLSHRGSLTFNLYELLNDKTVRCSFDESFKDKMRQAWGHVADVTGTVNREANTGRPLRIKNIENIDIIENGKRYEYLNARGALRNIEPAETIIRKLRDGELAS